ncbi:Uncharacterised protein [[Clostridium] sordellii]|uniref:hypothetical protein n=1 Tax=Paraclostridium sordellii TaxID=1505 RepID=UPI0005E02BBA|nr:hypothetical protein [Paeniclostridium sordellii]CEN75428.1 Uncharacterised protein [[Clostridium] sordellii] [Paeniclostridium sordellii]
MFVFARISFAPKVYAKMSEEDVKNFLMLYEKIKEIENIARMKNIAQRNNQIFLDFIPNKIKKLNNKKIGAQYHNNFHEEGLELVLKSILLSRTFTENTTVNMQKNFLENSQEMKKFNSISKSKDAKLLRLLRNYTFHYTLPISTSAICYDLIKKTYTEFNFYAYKNELLENKFFKDYETEFINKSIDDKLIYNDYVTNWIKLIDNMYCFYIKHMSKLISLEFKNFYNKYNNYIKLEKVDVTDLNSDGTYTKYVINKDIYNLLAKEIVNYNKN